MPHKVIAGQPADDTILVAEADPATLGQLVALYEHMVFTQGTIWGIDSFDQWGVELGKKMAMDLAPALTSDSVAETPDTSTAALVARYRRPRGR